VQCAERGSSQPGNRQRAPDCTGDAAQNYSSAEGKNFRDGERMEFAPRYQRGAVLLTLNNLNSIPQRLMAASALIFAAALNLPLGEIYGVALSSHKSRFIFWGARLFLGAWVRRSTLFLLHSVSHSLLVLLFAPACARVGLFCF
jgi:hypothetical protein